MSRAASAPDALQAKRDKGGMTAGFSTTRGGTLIGGLSSLAFWLCLFVAAGLYAVVALSSKLHAYSVLNAEHESNQWRLVALEQQIGRMRQVIVAQQGDQAFVREQAQSDFALSRPDEQRIPVESHLTLHIGPGRPDVSRKPATLPAYVPFVHWIAASRSIGDGLLASAAALVIGAFTLLPVRRSAADEDGGE